MKKIYGKHLNKRKLLEYVGDISQIAGARPAMLTDGRGGGVNIIDVRTGSGLNLTILPGRAMDIGWAAFKDIPLSFISKTGMCHPSYYESSDDEFLRNFFGGLLTTCGLLTSGPASEDMGKKYVMHGRLSNTPAFDIGINNDWDGDDFFIEINGKVRQSKLYEENLLLKRCINTKLGSNKIVITDRIENQGSRPEEMMLLYHFNLGFPVLSENSILITSPGDVLPRDNIAAAQIATCKEMAPPTDSWPEVVFFHRLKENNNGKAGSVLFNPDLDQAGIGIYIKYLPEQLPWLIEWKQMGKGDYVLGMEPATYHPVGRKRARQEGGLVSIDSGETKEYQIEIGVVESRNEAESIIDS
jgi:hypothetical protein